MSRKMDKVYYNNTVAVVSIIEDRIRPYLREHNGDISIDSFDGKSLYLKLEGRCKNCPSNDITIDSFVRRELEGYIDEIHVISDIDGELLDLAKRILCKKEALV